MTRAGVAAIAAAILTLAGCAAVPHGPDPLPDSFIPDITASAAPDANVVGGFTALEREALRVRVRTCTAYGTGSGFAIDETHAVTNRHVIDGATDITLTGFDGTVYTGTASVVSPDADLALITIDGTFPNIVTLADAEPTAGDTLTIAGYPKGEALAVREGTYLGVVPETLENSPDPVYQIDAETHPGNSGSPVADAAGDVVGVVYASDDVHTTYAISLPTLKAFLDNLDSARKNVSDCDAQG